MKNLKGIVYALISSGTFGLIPLFTILLLTDNHMELSSILFYRFLFSAIIIGAICLIKKQSFRISRKQLSIIIFLGTNYMLTSWCLQYSYKLIPSGVATTIHYLYPIAVVFLMTALFKESKSPILIIASVMSLAGVGFLCWDSSGAMDMTGVLIASVTIFTYAITIVTINKSSVSEVPSLVLAFYMFLSSTIFLFFTTSVTSTGIQPITETSAWIRLLLLAFLPTAVSNLTLILAVRYAGSVITSILGSMEPLVAVSVGVLYFSESFRLNNFLGILLIIISVSIVILSRARQKPES
ncbi:DMT family transporter [Dysgonomonas sp. OttesenSCG-928-M03]|nr:DMT family transporter [Dysgonomonas sp. OttesenSCG-928-M03]